MKFEINRKELMELAVMGMEMKIQKKLDTIAVGEKLVEKMRNSLNVDMEEYEGIVAKLKRLKNELDGLYKYKEDLIWFDEIEELEIV